MTKVNLRKRREELGLRLEDVAAKVGVSAATVSRWESGEIANMKRSRIALLAEALKLSPIDIIEAEQESDLTDGDRAILRAVKGASEEEKIKISKIIEAIR